MTQVWIVVGWFGDQEWIEAVYDNEHGAEQMVEILAAHRSSEKGPEWTRGVQKFGIKEWELIA